MTIYAVLMCGIYSKAAILSTCLPTPYMNDLTAAACEVHRQYMQSFHQDIPGADLRMRAICMKKNVAVWSPVDAPASKPKAPAARRPVQVVAAEPITTANDLGEPRVPDGELRPIDRVNGGYVEEEKN